MSYEKSAKGRCWDGYEPVPGKKAYSDGSCQPAGGKKKKKKSEKEASSCGSHSKPKKKKSKKVEKAALEIATKVAAYRQVQEKQAQATRIKLATHVVRMDGLRQELDRYDPYQLSKSAAVGSRKPDRMKAAALVRQIELEKQAFVIALVRQLKLEKHAFAGLGTGVAGPGMSAKMRNFAMRGGASPRKMKGLGMQGAASNRVAANVASRGMKASGNAANVQSKAGIGKSVPMGMKALGLDRLK